MECSTSESIKTTLCHGQKQGVLFWKLPRGHHTVTVLWWAACRQEKGGSKSHLAGGIILSDQHTQVPGGDSVTSPSPSRAWRVVRGGTREPGPSPVVAAVLQWHSRVSGTATLAAGSAAFPGKLAHVCADPGLLLLCQRVHGLFPTTEAGFFHQPSASELIPPSACTAQYTQQNICCVLWWRTEYPTPHVLVRGEEKTGRAEGLLQTQPHLKWACQQLLLKGLGLGPQKYLLCPGCERVNRVLLNARGTKKDLVLWWEPKKGLVPTLPVLKGDCCPEEKKRKPGTAQFFSLGLVLLLSMHYPGCWKLIIKKYILFQLLVFLSTAYGIEYLTHTFQHQAGCDTSPSMQLAPLQVSLMPDVSLNMA